VVPAPQRALIASGGRWPRLASRFWLQVRPALP
jgi:hypothetical protein